MNETISLGVGGDINLIKSRIFSNPDCVFPVSITKDTSEDKVTYFNLEYNEDIRILDKYLNVLAEYIIDRYETKILRRIIEEEFGELSQKAKREIIKNVILFSDDKKLGYNARKKCILLALYDCLKEGKKMFLDGFVSFRLKEYEAMLYELIEKLADDYSAKREYEEFVDLLKYFVSVQSPRPDLLNVTVLENGAYKISNGKGEDITASAMSEFIGGEALVTAEEYDDILISILITVAPEKIIVHRAENIKNRDLFLTIKKVFEKVEYCTGCDLCL